MSGARRTQDLFSRRRHDLISPIRSTLDVSYGK